MIEASTGQYTIEIAAIEEFLGFASKDGMAVRLGNENYEYDFKDMNLLYNGKPLPVGVAIRVLAQFATKRLDELARRITDLRHEGNYRWTGQLMRERFDTKEEMSFTTPPCDHSDALALLVMTTRALKKLAF